MSATGADLTSADLVDAPDAGQSAIVAETAKSEDASRSTHQYATGGIFTITVTVVDDDTGQARPDAAQFQLNRGQGVAENAQGERQAASDTGSGAAQLLPYIEQQNIYRLSETSADDVTTGDDTNDAPDPVGDALDTANWLLDESAELINDLLD